MEKFSDIDSWVFDLDNTLYSAQHNLFAQIDTRMTSFISDALDVSRDEAYRVQKEFLHDYGTTLAGLMNRYKMAPDSFLDFVHDIDLEFLKNDKGLELELSKIKDKKIIFTNGSRAHAENVTKRIGINKLFDGIFDIVDSDFIPKPAIETYKRLIDKYKIEPQYCIFIEDIARNLKPAHELGMKTVWIKNNEPWAAKYSNENFINYRTENLTAFLKNINELRKN